MNNLNYHLGMTSQQKPSFFSGFYRLSPEERRKHLTEWMSHSQFDMDAHLSLEQADRMVENAISVFGLPLGVAPHFVINKTPVLIPMVTEEPSIIAAASHMAKRVRQSGGLQTETTPSFMHGQIHFTNIQSQRIEEYVQANRDVLIEIANGFCRSLVNRGGGVIDIDCYQPTSARTSYHQGWGAPTLNSMIVRIEINCLDAMGANIVNTVSEGLAKYLSHVFEHRAHMSILSNLSDRRLARAHFRCHFDALNVGTEYTGATVAHEIVHAYELAVRDPYRACTHNKGILNGIDAVAIATGNDWRALEAGAHAYACRDGTYNSLTRYRVLEDAQVLEAEIELPLAVGTVGGSTKTHPQVQLCHQLLGPFAASSSMLAQVMAAVGLIQNCAALRALVTTGIQAGHMRLHHRKAEQGLQ